MVYIVILVVVCRVESVGIIERCYGLGKLSLECLDLLIVSARLLDQISQVVEYMNRVIRSIYTIIYLHIIE